MMDRALARPLRYLQRVRRGKPAHQERKLSVVDSLFFWRIPTSQVELSVRRLKAYQRWVARPSNHVAEIAAVFGTTKMDREQDTFRTNEGKLTTFSTPWAVQFMDDVKSLCAVADVPHVYAAVEQDYRSLFVDTQLGEDFA